MGFVLPLDQGIHQTGASGHAMTLSLGVYGRSIRPGYIHFFHLAERKMTRAYRGIFFRRVLAMRAQAHLEEALGKQFLTPSLVESLPEELAGEFRQFSSN